MGRRSNADKEAELILEVKKRYEMANGAESENRRLFSEDLRFIYEDSIGGEGQWDSATLLQRRGRPSYTFNRVIGTVNLVLGDQRQTRPQVKIRAADKDSAVSTATILEGLHRDIEQCSNAEQIYDTQFKFAVAGGWGAWRIVPEYESDTSFNQVLKIKDIANPLVVFWDPESTDPCRGDAMWCIVAERISKDKYEVLYPDGDMQSLAMSRDSRGWVNEREVRIAEYFRKVPVIKTIAELSDGSVVDWDDAAKAAEEHMKAQHPEGTDYPTMTKTRDVKSWNVEWYLVDGQSILAGPITYKWKRIPVVRIPGRCVNIEGKQKVQSLVRHTKDPQRTYNYHRSTMVELTALTPRSPYIATAKMVKGYEDMWATANTNARPYLLYDVDPDVPQERPTREPPPDVPQALIALTQADLSDIQAATGYFDSALGDQAEQGDRTSGKALIARQRKSDLGSYEFIDNFGKALKLSVECIIDMIPTIYDTDRVVRVIGPDGVEKYEQVNGIQNGDLINSLKKGSYDCTVTIGPSYQTARQEMLATLLDACEVMPQIAQVAPDLIIKNIDTPDVDELVRRLRIPLIQSGVIQPTPDEKKNLPPPPQPNPMQQAELAGAQAKAQNDSARAQLTQAKIQASPLEQQKLIDDIIHSRVSAILDARKAGVDNAQGMVDHIQSQVEGAQDLHQSAQEHQQEIEHASDEHKLGLQMQGQQHAVDLTAAAHSHAQQFGQQEDLHAQKLQHNEGTQQQKLVHMKQQAKLKPKPASKK